MTVRRAVEAALGGPVHDWSGPHLRAWSWHYGAVTASGVALIVKVPRWDEAPDLSSALAAGPQDDTRAEFDALEAIRTAVAASGDAQLAAVIPVAYVPEVNAIVMERLGARPLGDRLRTDPGMVGVFAALGRWLDLFHGLRPVSVATVPTPAIGDDAPAGLVDAAARLAMLPRPPAPVGTIHGDLTLGNVLVTADDRVAVVDPNRLSGPLAADGGHLLAEVRVGRRQLRAFGRRWSPVAVEHWADALWAGQTRVTPEEARAAEGVAVLDRWSAFTDAGRGAVTRRLAGPVFARAVRRLLDRG